MRWPRPVPPATTVVYQPWRPRPWVLVITAAALFGLALGVVINFFYDRGPLAGYEYHLWRWQAETLPSTAFKLAGIGPNPGQADGEEAIRNYFRLTSRIRAAQDAGPVDAASIDALVAERAVYENAVERYVERLIDEAIREAGLQRSLPLFAGVTVTWPPVNIELTSPPRVLVRSPRHEIRRAGDTLLRPDVTFAEIERIEAQTDSDTTVSLVVPIGGLAAYPAILNADRSYDAFLETAAHEWIHHYLAFFPLGQQWGKGGDAYALNETTANIAGREIARLVREKHPIQLSPEEDGRIPPRDTTVAAPRVNFGQEMRKLRLEVDALLAEGRVEDAERTMEERRQWFAEHGIFIRRLNQAYFAFYGTYADSPASSDPIGPKVERVWELTLDIADFLAVMREVRTVPDLDRALAALERATGGNPPVPTAP
jgi:hypothetical protein